MPFKPDPFIIEKILLDQHWIRNETLMVGDTDKDIETGRNAGVFTCGVTYGSLTQEQLEQLNPNWIIHEMPEIIPIILEENI
jgi:phosphoglycolate phosphatase